MTIEIGRFTRGVCEVRLLVILAGEPYLSAQADTSATALEDASVRRGGADRCDLEMVADTTSLRGRRRGSNALR